MESDSFLLLLLLLLLLLKYLKVEKVDYVHHFIYIVKLRVPIFFILTWRSRVYCVLIHLLVKERMWKIDGNINLKTFMPCSDL